MILLTSLLFFCGVLSEDGKAGKTGAPGEGTCVQCHQGTPLNAGGGYVFIESSNMIFGQHALGQTYDMTVTVGKTGFGLFGFSVVALDANGNSVGSFTAGSDNHTESFTIQGNPRQYVTHNLNGGASLEEHTFNFQWTAPSEDFGTITFYATGLAANGNGMNAGDEVYSATMQSPVLPSTGLQGQTKEEQILWDPIRETLLVNDGGQECTLQVCDVQGKVIIKRVYPFDSPISFQALKTGYYVVTLTMPGKKVSQKILVP